MFAAQDINSFLLVLIISSAFGIPHKLPAYMNIKEIYNKQNIIKILIVIVCGSTGNCFKNSFTIRLLLLSVLLFGICKFTLNKI